MEAGLPGSSNSKESTYNAANCDLTPSSEKSPGEGNGNTLQFLPEEFHQQRSLVGYCPLSCKKLDTTKKLTLIEVDFLHCLRRWVYTSSEGGWCGGGQGQGALWVPDPCLLPSPSSVLWRGQGVCRLQEDCSVAKKSM